MDQAVGGHRSKGGVIREDDRHRSEALRVRLGIVATGVHALVPFVRMHLRDPREVVLTEMTTRLAHRLRGHVVEAGVQLGDGNRDGGDDGDIAHPNTIKKGDALHSGSGSCELIEQRGPQMIRNQNHRWVRCSSGPAAPTRRATTSP